MVKKKPIFALIIENFSKDNYVPILFNYKSINPHWVIPYPEITFEEFVNNINKLEIEIHAWLKIHSPINVNIKLEEPEKYN